MLSFSYYFSLCGGNPQYPRTVHINWTRGESLQKKSIPKQMKNLPFLVNCSEASNKL